MTATTVPATLLPDQRWRTVIEGVAAIIIGLLLIAAPAQTMMLFVQLLGIYWLITGVVMLVGMFLDRSQWGWKLLLGVLGVAAGLAVIQHPLWSAILVPTSLVVVLGVWGLIIGGYSLYQAFAGAGWGRAILGALNIFFGLVLLASPMLAAVSLPFVFGIFAVVGGIATLVMAYRERPEAAVSVQEEAGPAQRAA